MSFIVHTGNESRGNAVTHLLLHRLENTSDAKYRNRGVNRIIFFGRQVYIDTRMFVKPQINKLKRNLMLISFVGHDKITNVLNWQP
jgi:hypothetical protein